MDNEVSVSLNMAVVMVIIASVLTIVFVVFLMGKDFSRQKTAQAEQVQTDLYSGEIIATEEYGEPIPATSLFVILEKNYKAIKTVTGNVYGVDIHKAEDLKVIFDRKIRVQVAENSDGSFSMLVGEE